MRTGTFVIPLDDAVGCNQTAVGAKAAGLSRLKRLDLPVPDGFCISADAYRNHFNSAIPKSMINDFAISTEADVTKTLSEIRRIIVESPMDEVLAAEITSCYRRLGAERLAVRSSATAEDLPGHSFAGLYDTYLGIDNLEDCLIAVKKCWASLWTERAFRYRQKNGFDHFKVNMAVIVQALIPADFAGVIFTAEPVSGDDKRIVIEACPGLGDALVSGKVTPDRIILAKSGLNVLSRSSALSCISDETAQKLAKLAIKTEIEFGCPQNMEWAVCRDGIFLLQSRPITTISRAKSWEDRQIWSSFAAREVMPDVVTPITVSLLVFLEENLFKQAFEVMCIDKGKYPTYDVIAGRIYFNASLWAAVARHFRILRKVNPDEFVGSEPEMIKLVERFKNTPAEDLPAIRHNHAKFILRLPLLLAGILGNNRRKSQAIIADARMINEKWASTDISGLSAEQLADCLRRAITDLLEKNITGFSFLRMVYWMLYYPVLVIICRKWFPGEQSCAGRLLAGIGNMEDVEAGLDLWRLAVKVNDNPILKELIQPEAVWDVVQKGLVKSPAGEEFLADWNRFMKAHGHHCRAELEFYNRRWCEKPDYVLKILRGYLNSMDKTNPLENRRKIVEQREQLAERCREKLKNPVKRAVFNYLLSRARYGSVFRENLKSEVIKLIASVRLILLEIGRKLAAGSVIEDSNDVFFLKFEEIEPLAKGQSITDTKQIIAARRAEYKRWEAVTPPCVIIGKFDHEKYIPAEINADVRQLKGLTVSPGVVTGRARVILRTDDNEQVQAGEILVAPFTDPGWTPYFVAAGGIVMDQGGILSHGAIIAREYGIPGIVNVGNATKIIKTGQTIQVDGDRGVVRILK